MSYDPQVPWTEAQWARVNQAVQEEASRARVAATFLCLYGPLPPDTDFVRAEIIPDDPPLRIQDRQTIQLATLQVKVPVRTAQLADPEMRSVLAVFRRAANVLARLEDAVVFRGLCANTLPPTQFRPPPGSIGLQGIWEVRGGEAWDGLLAASGSSTIPVDPTVNLGDELVKAVSAAIAQLESDGHFGPFAVVLDQKFFVGVQTPDKSLVLPQDRIIPFLGGGPLLRSSTLPENSGVVVALGGAPVELVVAKDMSLQFLQVTKEPRFLFRVREKIALRIKEAKAIATLVYSKPRVFSVSPSSGPSAGGSLAKPYLVTIRGINFKNVDKVCFGTPPNQTDALPERLKVSKDGLSISVALPARRRETPANIPLRVEVVQQGEAARADDQFTYKLPPGEGDGQYQQDQQDHGDGADGGGGAKG